VDAVQVPVIAAGGIADARGLVAALALGAEGVQMGTRFMATEECIIHSNYKQAILTAGATDTVIVGRRGLIPARVLKSNMSQQIQEAEARGASPEEIFAFFDAERSRKAVVEGDTEQGSLLCGAVAGMITELPKAAEVVRNLVKGYNEVSSRL
jgi:enoyl-[acyl-carrier protein] reductase II